MTSKEVFLSLPVGTRFALGKKDRGEWEAVYVRTADGFGLVDSDGVIDYRPWLDSEFPDGRPITVFVRGETRTTKEVYLSLPVGTRFTTGTTVGGVEVVYERLKDGFKVHGDPGVYKLLDWDFPADCRLTVLPRTAKEVYDALPVGATFVFDACPEHPLRKTADGAEWLDGGTVWVGWISELTTGITAVTGS